MLVWNVPTLVVFNPHPALFSSASSMDTLSSTTSLAIFQFHIRPPITLLGNMSMACYYYMDMSLEGYLRGNPTVMSYDREIAVKMSRQQTLNEHISAVDISAPQTYSNG